MNNNNSNNIQNSIKKLEFNTIQEILSTLCVNSRAKNMALNLTPNTNKYIVHILLDETTEASDLIIKGGEPSFFEIQDISKHLEILKCEGTLSIKQILDLAKVFKSASELKEYFSKEYITPSEFPILSDLFSKLYSNQSILEQISASIINETTISDDASKELARIRANKRHLEFKIKDTLNKLIHSNTSSKYIQESIITIRNDRFVIPVKEEYKGQIKGFVHDISNAGSTIFIEPLSVFEINNELNKLKMEENIEIEKILHNLTNLFVPYSYEVNQDLETITDLDFVFAKAKYSKLIRGIMPKINNNKQITLLNARHPLIDPRLVVPSTIRLGYEYTSLLITRTKYRWKNSSTKNSRITYINGMFWITYSM